VQISGFNPGINAYFNKPQPLASEAARSKPNPIATETKANSKAETTPDKATPTSHNGKQNQQLTPTEQKAIQQLQDRDREVRAHEAAHKTAGGNLIRGSASFSQQRGPDGRLYAVGGEVSIDTGKVSGDPQATIQKANQIRAAALAPAEPSSQDRSVAAAAMLMAAEARKELGAENRAKPGERKPSEENDISAATETAALPSQRRSAETRHYQAVADNAATAEPPKLDLMA